MQTIIHVHCKKGPSLREIISQDEKRLAIHMLKIAAHKKPGRTTGWLKIRSTESDRRGAINLHWRSPESVLLCRVVNRGAGKPNLIVGDFLDYLLAYFRKRVLAVTILPNH
jgi:hypothetical protein